MNREIIPLSASSVTKIDWRKIEESWIGLIHLSADKENGPTEENVRNIFATTQAVFDQRIAQLEKMSSAFFWIVGCSIMLVFAGSILGQFFQNALSAKFTVGISVAGIIGLLPTVNKLISIHKDIVVLKLTPSKYELALHLAKTDEHRDMLFNNYLEDMSRLQQNNRKPSKQKSITSNKKAK